MDNAFTKKRNIDMVFCIDGTGSMGKLIENVKSNARRFHLEFVSAMTDLKSDITSMRIKVIVFRDYKDDGDDAMIESRFFELPADVADYESFLSSISANGGGDNPENGLEALYYAMKSDFVTGKDDRQVIVLFTDDEALPLGARSSYPNYPSDMADMNKLKDTWACAQSSPSNLRDRNKRLVLFAPDNTEYKKLSNELTRTIFQSVVPEDGMEEIDFSKIIKIIAASASGC